MAYNTQKIGWEASPSQLKLDTLQQYAVGTSALDLGCGRGWYASALADAGFSVTGIDQRNRVEDARITVLEQRIEPPLPFDDGAFDTVLMFDILEHLPDEGRILSEVARVCAQRVIISVPHADAGPLPKYGLTYLHYTDDTHLREYTLASLIQALEAAGFREVWHSLVGQPTVPLAFAEFVRGGEAVRQVVRYAITALYKVGLVVNESVGPDIFYVGERVEH